MVSTKNYSLQYIYPPRSNRNVNRTKQHHKSTTKTVYNYRRLQLPQPPVGIKKTNERGATIEQILTNSDIILLNTGTATRLNSNTGDFSSIDLTFADPNTALQCTWETLDYLYDSDHFPIKIEMPKHNHNPTDLTPAKWNISRADWNSFSHKVTDLLRARPPSRNIDVEVSTLTQVLTEAAETSIPRYKLHRTIAVPWWNNQCSEHLKAAKKRLINLKEIHH